MKCTQHHGHRTNHGKTCHFVLQLCSRKAQTTSTATLSALTSPGLPKNNGTSLLTVFTQKMFSPSWSREQGRKSEMWKKRRCYVDERLQNRAQGCNDFCVLSRRSKFKNTCHFNLIVAFSRLFSCQRTDLKLKISDTNFVFFFYFSKK